MSRQILKNIFSIIDKEERKIIKLFGFKIRLEFLKSSLWHISSLCTSGQFYKAEKLLKKYINSTRCNEIYKFLPVAKFAKSTGTINEKIEKAAIVFDELQKNKGGQVFENLIKGKTIAIVGNGPSEIGKGKGEEIDAHDIVIRFNNYKIEGFEKDYGGKTSIWIRGNGTDVEDLTNFNDYLCCAMAIDYSRRSIKDEVLDFLYDKIQNKGLLFTYFGDYSGLNVENPSTGLIAIYCIYQMKLKLGEILPKTSIYGFSFLQDKYTRMGFAKQYFENNRTFKEALSIGRHHNAQQESKFLKKLFDKKS